MFRTAAGSRSFFRPLLCPLLFLGLPFLIAACGTEQDDQLAARDRPEVAGDPAIEIGETEPETPVTQEPEVEEEVGIDPEETEPLAEETEEPDETEEEAQPTPAQCGNGIAEGNEVCDGTDQGDKTCRSFGFGGGSLGCANACNNTWVGDCTALAYEPLLPVGEGLNFQGALNAQDPIWSRPSAACEAGSIYGHRFEAYGVVNTSGLPQRISVAADFGTGDGFLHAFGIPFDPQTIDGCMVGNDDFGGINASGFSEIVVAPNQRLVFVVSTFAADADIAAYSLRITTEPETTADPGDAVDVDPIAEPTPGESATEPGCGNGIIDDGEVCDGSDLGAASCSALGYNFGIVACASSCNVLLTFCIGGDGEPGTEPGSETPPVGTDPSPIDPNQVAAPIAPRGQTQQLVGALAIGAPEHQRVDESCSAKTADGYLFSVQPIVNNSSHAETVTLTGNFDADGFLAVYTDAFSFSSPGAGCLAADDDFSLNTAAGSARLGARIENLTIEAGQMLYVVVSTFSAGDELGDYSVDVLTHQVDDLQTTALIGASTTLLATQGDLHGNDAINNVDNKERFYDAHFIENTSSKSHDLEVLVTWVQGDGMVYVYTFDANAPGGLGTQLAFDDDFGGQSASRISADDLYILPGEKLVVVATSYAADTAIGLYDITISVMH